MYTASAKCYEVVRILECFENLSIPMFAISVGMLYSACVKRCSQKESDYRFNYTYEIT